MPSQPKQPEPCVTIKNGYAFVPFDGDQLIWLIDQFPLSDTYRQVLWEAHRKLETTNET